MDLNEPFPLKIVRPRVRDVLLREFKGRCPSIREVKQIPDEEWLATPGMGPVSLKAVRSITNAGPDRTVRCAATFTLSDADLLRRLVRLQEDLRWLKDQLEARISAGARPRLHCRWHAPVVGAGTDYPGPQDGEPEAPHHQSGRDGAV
jgi:hypothetical protein